jgi:quercetin dioxygenase-like cupin family protein
MKSRTWTLIPVVLPLLCTIGFAQQNTERIVPVTEEPSHHRILENQYVRVLNVIVPPHGETLIHRHDYDYVFVTLGDSKVSNERVNEKPTELILKDGETRFTPGGFAHRARNLADTPFHNITVEFLDPELTKSDHAGPGSAVGTSGSTSASVWYGKILVEQRDFLNGEVSTCSGESTARPKLLVPVSELMLKGAPGNGEKFGPGQVVWLNAGQCRSVATIRDTPARFVLIGFPTPTGNARAAGAVVGTVGFCELRDRVIW